jgi:hypothetical protein
LTTASAGHASHADCSVDNNQNSNINLNNTSASLRRRRKGATTDQNEEDEDELNELVPNICTNGFARFILLYCILFYFSMDMSRILDSQSTESLARGRVS